MLWQKGYPVSYKPTPVASGHGKGPKSTPIIYSGKLFTLGITGILSCFDAGTGEIKWRRKFSDRFKNTYPIYGTAMSPLVDNNLIIAHVGGDNQGSLIACNVETGEIKWSWDGDGPGYTSPIVAELEGTRQIVTQTQKYCVGISFDTGELLWSIPFTTPYDQNIVTPVLYKQTVIFSGTNQGTMAIKVTNQGNKWSTKRVWYNPDVSMYMSSPVIKGDLLFGLAREAGGYFFCLNAATGRTLWKSDGRQGEYATILGAGDVLIILTDDAKLTIARQSSEGLEQIIHYRVADDQTWASPAPLGEQILIKGVSTLYLWSIE
jgi:outer membrane protein assembly factor BamB